MSYKEQFFKDFANYHGLPDDLVIESLVQECYYTEGCPTCGGDYEYTMYVFGNLNGKSYFKSVGGTVADFINSLG